MNLFERFEELSRIIDDMNAQAADARDIPVILLHDYVHYCDVQTFLKACTYSLRLSPAQTDSLMAFFYRDTLERKSELGALDLYTFTRQFFKYMTYRIGNLDTPDDCVEKLDMDILSPYRSAREKQWRGEALTPQERELLDKTVQSVLARCHS